MFNDRVKAELHLLTTCGEACWYAREDVCRCSCGGKNHGILRTADGKRPERTKHYKGRQYKLIAIVDGSQAFDMCADDYGSWLKNVGYGSGKQHPQDRIIYNKATESQEKWQEVVNVKLPEDDLAKYLVWERCDAPKDW